MAYALADKKWSKMTPEEQAQAGSRKEHKAAKEKAQSVLNATNTTQDPNKFPDGSPRDPATGNAPSTSSTTNTASNSSTTNTGGGITYDNSAAGKPRFDAKDIKNLKEQGYEDSQISEYANSLDRDQVGAAAQVKTGAYLPEDVSNLDNYDPMSIGNTRVAGGKDQRGADIQKSELKHLMEAGGHSAQELNEWAKANDYSLGGKAQKFLNKQLNLPTTDVTAPPDEEPDIDTRPIDPVIEIIEDEDDTPPPDDTGLPPSEEIGDPYVPPYEDNSGGGNDIEIGDNTGGIDGTGDGSVGIVGDGNVIGDDNQYIDGNNNNQVGGDVEDSVFVAGDNDGQIANNGGVAIGDGSSVEQNLGNTRGDTNSEFTMGDGSWFIGNNNQGADYSVVIGNQSIGGTGTFVPGYSSGLNNMQGAAGYGALNNNAFQRSQSEMNGLTRSAQASANAGLMTGANERIAGFDFAARSTSDLFRDKSTAQNTRYLGALDNYSPPAFVMPDPLKAIQPNYLNEEEEE